MGHPVVHWEIAVKDLKRAQDFYSKLFDWQISTDPAMSYAMVDTGDEDGINGGIMPTQENFPPYVTFYVEVDDLQAYLDKAGRLGGQTLVPPMPIPNMGAFAMFRDPEGNVIGLFREGGD